MKNRINKIMTAIFLAVISVLFLMTFTAIARELPLLVDVSQLGEQYDGKRVAVMGWARSAEAQLGRMGSHYVKTELGEEEGAVSVFSSFPPFNVVNNRVIVQGVYHHSGRYGGKLADHFIVAETLVRDWGYAPVPSKQGGE